MYIYRYNKKGNSNNSRMNNSVLHNPSLPVWIPLERGCFPGRTFRIQGNVPHHAQRFSINLQSGPGQLPPNINLHVNARLDQNTIVLNNCRSGIWGGKEERGHLPLVKGSSFEIIIHVELNNFRVCWQLPLCRT